LKQLPTGENFNGMQIYASTKLCNILFTRQLAQRLKDSGSTTTVNAVHPGVVRTTLGDRAGFLGFVIKVAKRLWKAPREGARGPVYLATSPDVAGVTGYYDGLKQKPYADVALDDRLAQDLWDLSAALTEL
jgi:NAD(P)-dependent dehydrogenase (short-subunit alcohol dehydrogenase family)